MKTPPHNARSIRFSRGIPGTPEPRSLPAGRINIGAAGKNAKLRWRSKWRSHS
jgi:hypothetical protein